MARAGGWDGMAAQLDDAWTHSWKYAGTASANTLGVETFGVVAGLGFVLSFGYGAQTTWWCSVQWRRIPWRLPASLRLWVHSHLFLLSSFCQALVALTKNGKRLFIPVV